MFFKPAIWLLSVAACVGMASIPATAQSGDKKTEKKQEKNKEVWTDAADPSLPADFKFQGEYVDTKSKIGCQVIALGAGMFQAVVCEGGLPGAGWDGKSKSLMDGKIEGEAVIFGPAEGKRKYLAKAPLEFSATAKFPPQGHKLYMATLLGNGLALKTGDNVYALAKVTRQSATLGKKAPDGAIVLFDGTSKDEWNGGRVDKTTGLLNTDGNDITTKRKFNNYVAHVEFLLPFRPDARGQGRGNSGFYQVDHYEVQILDSFGLDGADNECGGVYQKAAPKVNACLPPLQWQTYDVEFSNAVREGDKLAKKARLTVRHNGILIHNDIEIPGVTGGARNEPEGTPGLLRLQGHGNPLQFRNIWVAEMK